MEIIAQILGLTGTAFALASFQQKQQKSLIRMQFYSSILFSAHFLLLGAVMGCVLNMIGIVRAYVFSHREKPWTRGKKWILIFIAGYLLAYAATFLFLKKEPTARNLILEFIPVIGMTANTIGFYLERASQARALSLISSPSWLVYNALNRSIGGVITECFSLVSILTGILRLDMKRRPK